MGNICNNSTLETGVIGQNNMTVEERHRTPQNYSACGSTDTPRNCFNIYQ